ncbi:MAG: methyltransferase domain-containing protein [Vicinamibacterales bacterium]|nr:methyltransferase domain-containing protein [Vicinamibacterales bacterium]
MIQSSPPRGPASDPGTAFGEYYYGHCCGKPYVRNDEWLTFFGRIADRLIEDIEPRQVLDAGCALGLLVEALRDRGVEAYGVDLSSYAIDNLHEKVRSYCRLGSVADDFDRRYDLIVSIEVLEHMPAADAEAAVANFCRHADDVVFSSSPLDHREPTHINVHPPEHWAELFARHDFFRDTDFDATFITPWAARFRRRREPMHRVIRGYERRYWQFLNAATDAHDYSPTQQRPLEEAVAEAQRLAGLLRQAEDCIVHMERSAFWRLRQLWVDLRARLTGRP